ncbi:hypothetical protein ABEB36_007134 [Hypothenemus hampei]|uniref:Rotatin N-terminal domain-containing protein n=1 Tax=Hypothenemus hampei TaxID=57062 RepID=A0ABD1ET13_HYPHA
MFENNDVIPMGLIEKLSHRIPEIRERALLSIITKLEHGFSLDNNLSKARELLKNLFQWFLFEPTSCEEQALTLIKKILELPSGRTLINHLGKATVEAEIQKIKSFINPQYLPLLNKISDVLCEDTSFVPPLMSVLPLSYRSDNEDNSFKLKIGSTASTIQGLVEKGSSQEPQLGIQVSNDDTAEMLDKPTYRNASKINSEVLCYLKWQPLIETDRHVLESVENSLNHPEDVAKLFHSCEFFIDVLLHDFPAEVFLQRPTIVNHFHLLLNKCKSSKVTNVTLQCLVDLTKELQCRVNYCKDPNVINIKTTVLPELVTIWNETFQSSEERGERFEMEEETRILKDHQNSLPNFCFTTMKVVLSCMGAKQQTFAGYRPKLNQIGQNLCLILLNESINLLFQCVKSCVHIMPFFGNLHETLSIFGDVLEYFRLESLSQDQNLLCRAIYLTLLSIAAKFLKKFIPINTEMPPILPTNLKISLTNSLVDITLGRLYPQVHRYLLDYVQIFYSDKNKNYIKRFQDTITICDGLSATVKFLQNDQQIEVVEKFKLASEALISLEFHKSNDFLTKYIDMCSNEFYKYRNNEEIGNLVKTCTLTLLAHRVFTIQEQMYILCHKIVLGALSARSNTQNSGCKTMFLFYSDIILEIALFGMKDDKLRLYAEEILLYILKSKFILGDSLWRIFLEALLPTMPILMCWANNTTSLGRCLVNLADPDTAASLEIPHLIMLKINVQLLFNKDSLIRDEAFSRLCWLLAKQENCRDYLPKFNTIYDKALSNVCNIKSTVDVNKLRKSEHFYQPSSLQQVLELLNSSGVEPVIRRSALNQISVMIEDHLLHDVFLASSGVELLANIMKRALRDSDFSEYPDSIVPIVSALKTLCLFVEEVRETLSDNSEVFQFILRGMFLFFTDNRMRMDGSILLFLLVFKDFITGSPLGMDFAVPELVKETTIIPISCVSRLDKSTHATEDFYSEIVKDKWSLSSLQIQWNGDLHGGFDKLIDTNQAPVDDKNENCDILALQPENLLQIRASSLHYCIKQCLITIQNATNHQVIETSLNQIALYLLLYNQSQCLRNHNQLLAHPWEKTLSRYVDVVPSSIYDIQLLNSLIKFLVMLLPFYKDSDECWIIKRLQTPAHPLYEILANDIQESYEDGNVNQLNLNFLKLLTVTIACDNHRLDFYSAEAWPSEGPTPWGHVVKTLAECLRLNDTHHFYNLAYLDALLSCLVNVTARLGWSHKHGNNGDLIRSLTRNLSELLTAFHCGKGTSAQVSVMGLSISRNVIFVLNHLMLELRHCKIFSTFFDFDDPNLLRTFLSLWTSRDVIIRAAALQIFINLTDQARIAEEVVQEMYHKGTNLYELALTVLTDNREAGIVRENAALLLINLNNYSLISNGKEKEEHCISLLKLLDDFDFFYHTELIITSLFTLKESIEEVVEKCGQSNGSSNDIGDGCDTNVTTPGVIAVICGLLCGFLDVAPKEISEKLHERGLVKLIFRTLCPPTITIDNKKELSIYSSLLEMNQSVCALLRKVSVISPTCLGTVLHTNDCLHVLFQIIDPKNYYTHLVQLLYLRNKLWKEIFQLIAIFLEIQPEDEVSNTLSIIHETIQSTGLDNFLEALCESLTNPEFNELQNASLKLLVAILRAECHIAFTEPTNQTLKDLLDSTATPKKIYLGPKPQTHSKHILRHVFFEPTSKEVELNLVDSEEDSLMIGADLCRILLYLYEVVELQGQGDGQKIIKKTTIIQALSGLLSLSFEAKTYALNCNFLNIIVKDLMDFHIKLSLESVETLRRVQERKRLVPVLQEVADLLGVLTNFMLNFRKVQLSACRLNIADLVHKLWIWLSFQSNLICDALRMLCVYTLDCPETCRSLILTCPVAGTGPRKTPGNVSLLHTIVTLAQKDMDLISRSHDLQVLEFCFDILQHCTEYLECRIIISKTNLFQSIQKLHPAMTKRQRPWDRVENIWLEFLQMFTIYPEGQSLIGKNPDLLELLMMLANTSNEPNRKLSLLVLRNVTFYQSNRPRLLSSNDFLHLLQVKLVSGDQEEKKTIAVIMWSMAANNQKGKLAFKTAKLDLKLENAIKCFKLKGNELNREDLELMELVLGLLREPRTI